MSIARANPTRKLRQLLLTSPSFSILDEGGRIRLELCLRIRPWRNPFLFVSPDVPTYDTMCFISTFKAAAAYRTGRQRLMPLGWHGQFHTQAGKAIAKRGAFTKPTFIPLGSLGANFPFKEKNEKILCNVLYILEMTP